MPADARLAQPLMPTASGPLAPLPMAYVMLCGASSDHRLSCVMSSPPTTAYDVAQAAIGMASTATGTCASQPPVLRALHQPGPARRPRAFHSLLHLVCITGCAESQGLKIV